MKIEVQYILKCHPFGSALVIKEGVVYANVRVSRHLKEGLAWAICRQLWVISNIMLFETVIPQRK